MATADRHSRLVVWLKVALPLAALSILATLFLLAESLDPDAAIPFAEVDVERILREQGVTQPLFGAVTTDGTAVSIKADSVRPTAGQEDVLTASAMTANLVLPDGSVIDIASPRGTVNGTSQLAVLDGGSRLESSTGYVVETQRITTSMAQSLVIADGEVRATGPAGDLTAGRMSLRQSDAYLLLFKDGVRLVYTPQP